MRWVLLLLCCGRLAGAASQCPVVSLSDYLSEPSGKPHTLEDLQEWYGAAKSRPEFTDEALCILNAEYKANAGDSEASTAVMYNKCSINCQEKDITVLAGAPSFGFDLRSSLQIFMDPSSQMSQDDEVFCRDDESLCALEAATTGVVEAMTELSFATLMKQSSLGEILLEAQQVASDPDNSIEVTKAAQEQKASVIRGLYENVLNRFTATDGTDPQAQALDSLQTQFSALEASFDLHVANFESYLAKCNAIIPRTDSSGTMVFDLCSVNSESCIEEAADREGHVSCACMYNPVSELPGLSRDPSQNSIGACTFFDICSEYRGATNEFIRNVAQEAIDKSVYATFLNQMEEKHGDKYRAHDYEATSDKNLNLRLSEELPEPDPGTCSTVRLRDLQAETTADLPNNNLAGAYEQLKVIYDFQDAPGQDTWCDSRFGQNVAPIFERCSDFCGSSGVPLQVGTPSSPLRLREALEVCFHETVVGSHTDAAFCSGEGKTALVELQQQLATFVASVIEFRTSQLLFITALNAAAEAIKEYTSSPEFANEIRSKNNNAQRRDLIIDIYKANFDAVQSSEDGLVSVGNVVKSSFEALRSSFEQQVTKLKDFADKCGGTFPRSAGDQAILAVCNTGGQACAEEPDAEYVFCCCAENPSVTAVGDAIDVCSEAKSLAQPGFNQKVEAMEQVEKENTDGRRSEVSYWESYRSAMQQKYGDDYDPPPLYRVNYDPPPVYRDSGGIIIPSDTSASHSPSIVLAALLATIVLVWSE